MPALTVSALVNRFHRYNDALVASGRYQPATATGYRFQLNKLPNSLLRLKAESFTIERLAECPSSRHFLAAIQRLYGWAIQAQAIRTNPIGRIPLPPTGRRERTLEAGEMAALLSRASRPYRRFWAIQRHTMARPQELRGLRWGDVLEDRRLIRLRDFKAKDRRRDGAVVRYIPLDGFAARLLARMRRNRRPNAADWVFPNRSGRQLTHNAVRIAFQRTAHRAGIDQSGERAVCYTIRHTSATEATRNGVRDRMLADIMGHTDTKTTARYQHLAADDLVRAIDQATRRPGRKAG